MEDQPNEPAHATPVAEQPAPRAEKAPRISRDHLFEIVAAIVLGVATVAAAWSGYQAALWGGVQSADYVRASGYRVESTKASTASGQDRLFDSQVFSQWLNAYETGNATLAHIYERRFRPEFTVAWNAWMATDPFTNPSAPPGPLYMPQYVSASGQQAVALDAQADAMVAAGEGARSTSDHYVFYTVIFALTLFLAGVSDRFRWWWIRLVLLAMASGVFLFGLVNVISLPIR